MKKKRREIADALLLPIVLLVFIAFYYLGPFRLCSVVSGSMEPNLPTWSLCVINVKTPYADIKTGDIVVYNRKSDATRIIHRVIEITDSGMITKGDANSVSDGLSVTPENLYGKYLFHVPKLGKLPTLIRTPVGIAVTGVVAAALIISMTAGDMRALRKKKEAAQQGTDPEEK